MKCTTCESGEVRAGVGTLTVDKDGQLSVLRHVPANVCDQCGVTTYDGEISAQAFEQMKTLRASGAATAITEFQASGVPTT